MLRRKLLFVIFATAALMSASFAQSSDTESKFPPAISRTFHEIAQQLYTSLSASDADARQAMVFLNAAISIDNDAEDLLSDIITLGWLYPQQNYTDAVYIALDGYVDASCDLELAGRAVRYLIERLDSIEDRQAFLTGLKQQFGDKNNLLGSDLAVQLSLLMAEKGDYETAGQYMMLAYNNNPYNKLAFSKLRDFAKIRGDDALGPVYVLQHWRVAMRADPLDLNAIISFAGYCESLELSRIAADAYGYAADLYAYLNAEDSLPASIYLPWMLNCYSTEGRISQCEKILERVRGDGRFDIFAETIAAKAAIKLGNAPQGQSIFATIDSLGEMLLAAESIDVDADMDQFAWYYCFGQSDPEKALIWATKAYEAEPNAADAAAILAYALVMNGQNEIAKPMLEQISDDHQIAMVAEALILEDEKKSTAIELLNGAIEMDPASLEAEYAKALLEDSNSPHIGMLNIDAASEALENEFGLVVPKFAGINELISVKLSGQRSQLQYGSMIDASVIITNKSQQPVVISPEGLFKGNIRVDAEVKGDINATIPKLVTKKIRPSLAIEPEKSSSIPLQFSAGALEQLLNRHPQASLDIELTLYLDPIVAPDGTVSSLIGAAPARLKLTRPAIQLNTGYMKQRLGVLKRGQQGQKLISARLFTGLIAEQQSMTGSKALYRYMRADPALLNSAVLQCLEDEDTLLKIQTMAAMLPLRLDYELVQSVAADLGHDDWPIRMMAMFLLGKSDNSHFQAVLNDKALNDPNPVVRDMAAALGATVALPQDEALSPADANNTPQEPNSR